MKAIALLFYLAAIAFNCWILYLIISALLKYLGS